jgi:hypothetical protein
MRRSVLPFTPPFGPLVLLVSISAGMVLEHIDGLGLHLTDTLCAALCQYGPMARLIT